MQPNATLVLRVAAVVTVLCLPLRVQADVPGSLRITPELALSSIAPAGPALAPPSVTEPRDLARQLRRARTELVVGVALAVSGIVHAAVLGNRHVCYESRDRPLAPILLGGLTASLG